MGISRSPDNSVHIESNRSSEGLTLSHAVDSALKHKRKCTMEFFETIYNPKSSFVPWNA